MVAQLLLFGEVGNLPINITSIVSLLYQIKNITLNKENLEIKKIIKKFQLVCL